MNLRINLLVAIFFANIAYAIIAPILPLEYESRNISPEMIGCIFAIYSVSIIFGSPFIGAYLL